MLLQIKPKTARAKRALAAREPQVNEGAKQAVFVRGSSTSQVINSVLKDLYQLKKPDGVLFSKKNDIHPFEDASSLEFFSQKQDASLFAMGTHSKKRPHNLTLVRMFDYQVLDMLELGVENYQGLQDFKRGCGVGMKPLFLFQGPTFASSTLRTPSHDSSAPTSYNYALLQSLLMDFFRGDPVVPEVNLSGLEHIITATVIDEGLVALRVYAIDMMKSGTRTPRIELTEMGPRMDLRIKRVREGPDDVRREALRVPKESKPAKVKNVERDIIGDKLGRIHMQTQDFSKLQTRKMKGLKKNIRSSDGSSSVKDDSTAKMGNKRVREKSGDAPKRERSAEGLKKRKIRQ